MKRRTKRSFDETIAAELALDVRQVEDITEAFLDEVKRALVNRDEVFLSNFGTFRVSIEKGQETETTLRNNSKRKPTRKVRVLRKFRVHFSRAGHFKHLVRAKYGPNAEKK